LKESDILFQKLREFIVHNDERELLEAKLKEFNPLKVLRIEWHEIRHSNILAWLLNPRENHNFGDIILKKVLSEIISTNENIDVGLSLSRIQASNFYDVEIQREWNGIDILAVSKSNRFILLIENKIYSKEGEGQVDKYVKKVKNEYQRYQVLPVLLTLTSAEVEDPKHAERASLSHERIYEIVKFALELRRESMNAKVYDFVSYYIKTLEVLTMQSNNEIVKLCKDIYRQHKEAIDAIIECGVTSPLDHVIDEFKKGKDIIETFRNNTMFWFVPKSFEGKLPKIADGWVGDYPVSCWFRFSQRENWMGIVLEVGPFKVPQKRVDFMKFLNKSDKSKLIKVNERALNLESKYTRIFSKYITFNDWDQDEAILEKMSDIYDKAKEPISYVTKFISEFKW